MNAQPTSDIRELNAAELDAVSGGYNPADYGVTGFDFAIVSGAVGAVVFGIVAWITDLF